MIWYDMIIMIFSKIGRVWDDGGEAKYGTYVYYVCVCTNIHTYGRPYVRTYVSYKKYMSISPFMYGTVQYGTGCYVAFVFLCVNRVCSYRFIRTYIYKNSPTVVLHQDTHTDIYRIHCFRTQITNSTLLSIFVSRW